MQRDFFSAINVMHKHEYHQSWPDITYIVVTQRQPIYHYRTDRRDITRLWVGGREKKWERIDYNWKCRWIWFNAEWVCQIWWTVHCQKSLRLLRWVFSFITYNASEMQTSLILIFKRVREGQTMIEDNI